MLMGNEFVTKEVDKIMKDKNYDFPLNLAMSAVWIIGNFKGVNLKVLNLKGKSPLADYYIIGSASNSTQANSMAEEIQIQLRRLGSPCRSIEGKQTSEWILLDHRDVIVHIFQDNTRDIYDLDGRFEEAEPVEIPQEFYFSHEKEENNEKETSDKEYF